VRGKISSVKDYLYKLLSAKHAYDEYTIEGIAKKHRDIFLIENCVKDLDVDPEHLLSTFYSSQLSDTDIRKIARTSDWVIKWIAMKNGCRVLSKNLTEEQERLIRWTLVYENMREQEDCPPDEIFADDDAFDGFLSYRIIGDKDSRLMQRIEGRLSGKKYSELYVPVANIEEAKRLDAQNSEQARAIKNARFQQVIEQGCVAEQDFKDSKAVIQLAKNRMEMGR